MALLYGDPSSTNLLVQILAPAFVVVAVGGRILKEKIVRRAQILARLITREKQ